MPINLDKMKQERAAKQFGGELIDLPEGDTQVYICALPRPTDDVPYKEFKMHYSVGKSGKKSHMCLEPAVNRLLTDPDFIEQCAAFGKDVKGGCPTCERLDHGDWVSGDPDESGKPSSRYLWLIVPIATRTDARQAFKPWGADEVKGLSAPYRVWDGIMDQFGQCGDITDMDAAIFVRIVREGTKMSTKWEVQIDVDSVRKPVKLKKELREVIAQQTAIGETYDPLRILAGMLVPRAEVERYFTETEEQAKDEYETPAAGEEQTKPAGGFKPPGKGGGKPADTKTAPAKQPATTKQPAGAGGTQKAAPKPEPKPSNSNGASKANAALKALTAKHGAPPSCFEIDPDAEAEICIKCPFQEPCFDKLGVPRPQPAAEEEQTEEQPADGMTVEQCVAGEVYTVNGVVATFKGPAKGQFYFTGSDNKPFKVAPGTAVEPHSPDGEAAAEEEAPAAEDEDAKMKQLEAELAARKAGAAKKAGGAPAKK